MLSVGAIKRRRWVVGVCSITITLLLGLGFGHRGAHMVQNLLVPGLGLQERSVVLAIFVFATMIIGIIAWIRWGVDWLPLAIVTLSTAAAGLPLSGSIDHHAMVSNITPQYYAAAHEFPIVVAVVAALFWLQGVMRSIPLLRRLVTRPVSQSPAGVELLPAVEASQGAILGCLANSKSPGLARAADSKQVQQRAKWIGRVARFRFGEDAFAVDHGLARAALCMHQLLSQDQLDRFLSDAKKAPGGVPCSEPGWVRLLDGTLTAIALHEAGDQAAGDRWQKMLAEKFPLKRGHRAATCWVPLGMSLGNATLWEHALALALARHYNWSDDGDWQALRPALLGAASRGVQVVDDERAIAAGRLWLRWTNDEQAERILTRPTIGSDPVAKYIEAYGDFAAQRKSEVI